MNYPGSSCKFLIVWQLILCSISCKVYKIDQSLPDAAKFSPTLSYLLSCNNLKGNESYLITADHEASLQHVLNKYKSRLKVLYIDPNSNSARIDCRSSLIVNEISKTREIVFIDLYMPPKEEASVHGYNRSIHGINLIEYKEPDLHGNGITIGVKERAIYEDDIDLYLRVLPSEIASNEITKHATEIASILAGAGNSYYDGRGLAYSSKLYSSTFSNLFTDADSIFQKNNISVQNHSYGTIPQAYYGAEAKSYDLHTWKNTKIIHVFSSGNNGELSSNEGKFSKLSGWSNLTGNFKSAKNILTVGGISGNLIPQKESSSGPMYDGRIAPQIMAHGPGGTSDAAAIVSGTIALLQQAHKKMYGILPDASLVKALLINNAIDMESEGPKHKSGYGIVNPYETIKALQNECFYSASVSNSSPWTKKIYISSKVQSFKATLAWTDTASEIQNTKALIHDLDLQLTEIKTNTIYRPWVLPVFPNADSLLKPAKRDIDTLNTLEKISIEFPSAGDYEIKVTSKSRQTLPFHLSYTLDSSLIFYFTNPVHSSDFNYLEKDSIELRWYCNSRDKKLNGELFYSNNEGNSWERLYAEIPIINSMVKIPRPEKESPVKYKMTILKNDFISNSVFLSKPTNLHIDYNCSDSFSISWNPHEAANEYLLFGMTDSAYIKPYFFVKDTSIKLPKSFTSSVLAIQPILNIPIEAERSRAKAINSLPDLCYYESFYGNVLEENKAELILMLTTLKNIDSVYFEKLNTSSNQFETIDKVKPVGQKITSTTNTLYQGTNVFRAKIRLKNNVSRFTDTISLVSSGVENILFYPNPVKTNSTLYYELKQGILPDISISIYDVTGKVISNYTQIFRQFTIGPLASGIYLYTVTRSNNSLISKGKLIVY